MNDLRELRRENRSLRDGFERLSGTVLRVNSSLDLDTVLREVVDSARALTGAGKGAITTVDGRGRLEDFVTSGASAEEVGALLAWPEGPRLFEHLRDIEQPFQLADLPGYIESLGFPPGPWPTRTMAGAPMRHRGEHVGTFFVGDKKNGESFTPEDEEILVLFASQAAAAIVNARTHREVERARADLEALIETSPVGVVVLEAGSGRVASVNREALRIVEEIRTPGSPPEQLLEVLTCRLPDGRQVSLAELSLAGLLEGAAPMRAEEVELSVPDGRSVRTLLNLTPIRSGDGEVVSVVATLQDLAPFEEFERQRADFLRLVSHELRAPLASIKGSAGTVLEAAPAASRAEMIEFFRLIDGQANHMRGLVANLLDAGSIEAGTLTVAPEPTNVASLVDLARTTFLSGGSRHPVLVELPPGLPLAMADRERIVQVLNNLFANAARHAPEPSPIRVEAMHDGTHVAISVSDEGSGIPPEELPRLFRKARPGLRGGSGLGLAISKGLVEAHGGRIRAESAGPGLGARFTFTLPAAADEAAASGAGGPVRSTRRRGRTRVLVLDDDPLMLRFVRDAIAAAGWTALSTGDPRELERLIDFERPDLVLLDLVLPGIDGIELMKRIPELAELPVIFISGYGNDETIAKALELGATDYIVKPFSPTELVARIRAALRRRDRPEAFVLGDLHIRYDQRLVTIAGRKVELTATEYELLRVLSQNAGRVLTYDRLLRTVWGQRGANNPGPVRTFVKKLRHKLGDDAASPAYILTERAVGYRMPEPRSSSP
ncbi:response regulator [Candidatus Palauibacter sp.]|uniref:response regulator n=1 Tax=Candidatus Palauibacter sp. TaxID=3101350 RepID=UPI003D0EA3B2